MVLRLPIFATAQPPARPIMLRIARRPQDMPSCPRRDFHPFVCCHLPRDTPWERNLFTGAEYLRVSFPTKPMSVPLGRSIPSIGIALAVSDETRSPAWHGRAETGSADGTGRSFYLLPHLVKTIKFDQGSTDSSDFLCSRRVSGIAASGFPFVKVHLSAYCYLQGPW